MTNDEKAKAYEMALERAKNWCEELPMNSGMLKDIFPELRESEDERIRKWLVDYFSSIKETVWIHKDITCEQIISWLEKQKEQKPAWSEEDERRIDAICELLENTSAIHPNYSRRKLIIWLKSLRPSWKPSEEQMEALEIIVRYGDKESTHIKSIRDLYKSIRDLYEQLKKL